MDHKTQLFYNRPVNKKTKQKQRDVSSANMIKCFVLAILMYYIIKK